MIIDILMYYGIIIGTTIFRWLRITTGFALWDSANKGLSWPQPHRDPKYGRAKDLGIANPQALSEMAKFVLRNEMRIRK